MKTIRSSSDAGFDHTFESNLIQSQNEMPGRSMSDYSDSNSMSDINQNRRQRRPSRRQSVTSDRIRAFSKHSGGIERKLSVLDDASSENKSGNGREDIKKKIEMNKGVRDLHFEL